MLLLVSPASCSEALFEAYSPYLWLPPPYSGGQLGEGAAGAIPADCHYTVKKVGAAAPLRKACLKASVLPGAARA